MVTRCFSGFKIAGFNDICFAAFALASGCSSSTAVHARAAVTKPKPKPNNTKDGLESETRRQLHAYIRDICKPLENEPTVRNKKHTHEYSCSREAIQTRWNTYVECRVALKQKVWGSRSLFARVWRSHTEILQQRVTGHDVCDRCAELDKEEAEINHRTEEGQALLRKVQEKRKVPPTPPPPHSLTHSLTHSLSHSHLHSHSLTHSLLTPNPNPYTWFPNAMQAHKQIYGASYDYFDDARLEAEHRPSRVTTLNIDSPTKNQMDLPRRNMRAYDSVKNLVGALKWSSKMTGCMPCTLHTSTLRLVLRFVNLYLSHNHAHT